MNEEDLEQQAHAEAIQGLIEEREAKFNAINQMEGSSFPEEEEEDEEEVQQPQVDAVFDPSKDYKYYAEQGMSREEWNRRQLGGGADADMAAFAEDPRAAAELAAAIPLSLIDFGIDHAVTTGSVLPPTKYIPGFANNLQYLDDQYDELTKFENDYIQKIRNFSSVVIPTMVGVGVLSNGIRGMQIGNLLKGAIGVTGSAGIDAAVIGVSDQGLEDNTFAFFAETFPDTFGPNGSLPIPEALRTLDGEAAEVRRHKNMLDSVGFSFVGDLLGFMVGGGTKVLKWFQPKDAKSTAHKASEIAKLDPESVENIALLEEAIRMADTPADAKRFKETRDTLLSQMNEAGYTEARRGTDLEIKLEQAEASRQVQIDEEAIRRLEAPVATFDPFITPYLARPGALAVQTIPPASVARNMADVAAIKTGVSTGDPAPVLSEPFMKDALNLKGGTRNAVAGLAESARDAGKFDATINGFRISARQMKEVPWDVYTDIMTPVTDPALLRNKFIPTMDRKVLQDEFGNDIPVYYFNEKQTLASAVAINDLVNLYLGREVTESSARLMDTFGREITSFSEGLNRFEELADDDRVMEMVLDKLEFLMVEHGLNKYIAGWSLKQKQSAFKLLQEAPDPDYLGLSLKAEFDEVFAQRTASVKQFRQTIETLRQENPEAIRPMLNAFAMSNGDVDTISKMYAWARKQISPKGLVVSPDPGELNLFAKGFWAVRYNNVLSGLAAGRAFLGNGAQVINKTVTNLLGHGIEAMMKGDIEPIKRSLYYHSAARQTMHRALEDAITRVKQVHTDPKSFERAIRRDYVIKEDAKWETLDAMVPMWEKEGNLGMLAQYKTAKAMYDFSQMPTMRYGQTLMSGIDAGTDTFMATAVSRYRAYDDVFSKYGSVTPELLLEAEKKHYSKMFDHQGVLTDEAVRNMSGEIALNLDDNVASFINKATQNAPILKALFMFPRTSMNGLKIGLSYTPVAAIPGITKYGKVLNAGDDIDKIKIALAAHGIKDFDKTPNAMAIYKNLQAEYRGRLALSALTVSVLYGYAMQGNIRSNGPVNGSERKNLKDNYNWQEKTIKIGDKWISYAGIVPLDPLLSIIGDIAYYQNDLGPDYAEHIAGQVMWTLSATWLNNTPLQGIEPILKGLNGDESAFQRFVAQNVRASVPMSGALGVVSQAITNAQKDIYNDMIGYIANRIPGASSTLPVRIDYWTGNPINEIDNPILRALNALSPIKVSNGGEPWREWLYNTGWDGFDFIKTHSDGYEYTPEMREEIGRIIGKMELWKKVDEMSRNEVYNKELEMLRAARRNPAVKDSQVAILEGRSPLYRELNRITREAKEAAEYIIENNEEYADIRIQTRGQKWVNKAVEQGNYPEAQRRQRKVQEQLEQIRQLANP